MPAQKLDDTVLIVDDEIHNMLWMIDYLESKSLKVITAETVNEALDLIDGKIYRALIVDLNIPILPPIESLLVEKGLAYQTYPGLLIADRARNFGCPGRQVMLYSVHRDPIVTEAAAVLSIAYIMKGRPHEIKDEVDAVLAYKPRKPRRTRAQTNIESNAPKKMRTLRAKSTA